jgi:type II secretory pathway component GspD/PulD (secretin)
VAARRSLAAALVCAAWCLPARGQDEVSQEEGARVFVAVETVDLGDLMDFWIATKNLNLQFEEGALEGPVKLRTSAGVTVETLWAITNRELVAKGLACIQVPGEENLSVVPLERAGVLARLETDLLQAEAGYVRTLYTLRHADPSFAAATAKAVLAEPEGKVTELEESKQLLVAGLKPQVLQALAVLVSIDVPKSPPAVVEHVLEYASPVAVQTAIEQVLPARAKVAGELKGKVIARPESGSVLVIAPHEELAEIEALIRRFDRVAPTVARTYIPRRFGLAETAKLVEDTVGATARKGGPDAWRVVQDALTGSLLVTATPEVHGEVEKVMQRLADAPMEARFGLRSIPVRHRAVEDLLGMLEDMLDAGQLPSSEAGPPSDQAAPQGDAPIELEKPPLEGGTGGRVEPIRWQDQLTLSADPRVNRILAVGERRLLDEVEALVAELDVHFPQVLIETLVLSLNESQTRDLGVELQKIGTVGDAGVQLASLFDLGSPDPASGLIPPASGLGGVGVVFDPGEFSAVVRALVEAVHET